MSEYRSEARKTLEGIESVAILNPVGRIELSGWDEPDLFIDYVITMPDDKVSSESVAPEFKTVGNVLNVMPPRGAMSGENDKDITISVDDDMEDISDEFSGGFTDFIAKIVKFSHSSGKKVQSGIKIALDIRIPKTMPITVKNLSGVIAISNMSASVTAKGLNGPVSLNAITGPVMAKTVNGPVTIEKSYCPEVALKSVNGPVKCYLMGVTGPISLKTVNGPVRMMIPQYSDIDLTAKTLHGAIKISSDFVSQSRTSRQSKATLNKALHQVHIKSATGSITVITTDETKPEASGKQQAKPVRESGISHTGHKKSESDMVSKMKSEQTNGQKKDKVAGGTDSPSNSLDSQIDRMLAAGKITADEADKLRNAI
jgi:hypothetical protein